MYRDFEISTKPEIRRVKDGARMRDRVEVTVTITERETRKVFRKTTPYQIKERTLELMILKNFPESTAAQWISSELNLGIVTLIEDLSPSNICTQMHTALRKICDSKAGTYWWSMINILPEGVMQIVWEETSKNLMERPRTGRLCDFACIVLDSWTSAFTRLYHAAVQWEQHRQICVDNLIQDVEKYEKIFDGKNVANKINSLKMAHMSIGYLTDSDYAGMLAYLYKQEA